MDPNTSGMRQGHVGGRRLFQVDSTKGATQRGPKVMEGKEGGGVQRAVASSCCLTSKGACSRIRYAPCQPDRVAPFMELMETCFVQLPGGSQQHQPPRDCYYQGGGKRKCQPAGRIQLSSSYATGTARLINRLSKALRSVPMVNSYRLGPQRSAKD